MTLFSRGTFQRSKFGDQPSSPKRKLAIIGTIISLGTLIAPLITPDSVIQTTFGSQDNGLLAINSPTFSLDEIAMTGDGFIMKTSAQTANVDKSEFSEAISYKVESGDTLSTIAHRFGISVDTILWENSLSDRHTLKIGSILNILPVSGVSHTVAAKETLDSIAKKYGVSTEKIAKQNKAGNKTLVAGMKLIIPDGKKIISTETAARTYVASSGRGTYASYRTSASAVDGTLILNNAEKDKNGRWMVKPVDGLYTTYFRPGHWAVDIASRAAPAIHAAANGTVVKSQCGWNGGYGCMVVIDHGDGYQTLYGHMSKLYTNVGEKVAKGDTIGKMGNTGNVHGVTGIHLHFEVVKNGRKVNPVAYYRE